MDRNTLNTAARLAIALSIIFATLPLHADSDGKLLCEHKYSASVVDSDGVVTGVESDKFQPGFQFIMSSDGIDFVGRGNHSFDFCSFDASEVTGKGNTIIGVCEWLPERGILDRIILRSSGVYTLLQTVPGAREGADGNFYVDRTRHYSNVTKGRCQKI